MSTMQVDEKVALLFQNSSLFQNKKADDILSFKMDEITPGALLGKGEFCNVREISSIDPDYDHTTYTESHELFSQGEDTQKMVLKKAIIASNCFNTNGKKYVIKYLNEEARLIPSHFETAISDITVETKFLAALRHPHIIKLHGFNKDELFSSDYFMVLERLEITLFSVMHDWRISSENKLMETVVRTRSKKRMKWSIHNILKILSSVSSALSYLHKKR